MRALQTAALGLAIAIGLTVAPMPGVAQADRMVPKGTMDAMRGKAMHGALVMGTAAVTSAKPMMDGMKQP